MPSARLATALIASLALLAGAATAHAAGPGDFVGMYSEDAFYRAADYRDSALSAQRAAGVGIERIPFDWRQIESAPGSFDFAAYDAFVASAARAGLELLPVVGDAPSFRSGAPAVGSGSTWYPPTDPADLGGFMAVLIGRYGPHGSFWDAHPELPRTPIENWQVWNEPNLPMFWGLAPDAAAYAELLRVTSHAIHAVDPGATVVSAGIPDSAVGVPFGDYLSQLYAAGFKGTFDVFGLHGYAPGRTGTLDLLAYARELLDQHGDGSPIWLTEFGWATGGGSDWFSVSEAEQAERIGSTLTALWQARDRMRLRGAVLFKWRDADPAPGQASAWPLYTGLLRSDGSAKPALASFESAVAGMQTASPVPLEPETSASPAPVTAPDGPAAPGPATQSALVVRWVELAGRRARLHVSCPRARTRCRGRLALAAGRRRASRSYSVRPAARSVLAVGFKRRVPLSRRWMTVRVSAPGQAAHAATRLLIRRLRR